MSVCYTSRPALDPKIDKDREHSPNISLIVVSIRPAFRIGFMKSIKTPPTAILPFQLLSPSPEQRDPQCLCFRRTWNDGIRHSNAKPHTYFHQVDFQAKKISVKPSGKLIQLVADIASSPRDPLLCPSVLVILYSIVFLLGMFEMGLARSTLQKERETPRDRPWDNMETPFLYVLVMINKYAWQLDVIKIKQVFVVWMIIGRYPHFCKF